MRTWRSIDCAGSFIATYRENCSALCAIDSVLASPTAIMEQVVLIVTKSFAQSDDLKVAFERFNVEVPEACLVTHLICSHSASVR